ncbi:MAG: hypothetical protein V1866_05855 [archaeon]
MKKGQAAMEFLMTYGWAILVVLAAIGALAYFGVLSPSKLLPNKCTLSPGFDFGDCKASTTGLMLSIRNGLGSDTTFLQVNVSTTAGSDVTCIGSFENVTGLANGALTQVFTLCPGVYTEGNRFDATVKITYVKSGEQLPYAVTGTITRRVEQ